VNGATVDSLRVGLAATAFGFGLRHGIDWDHLAAITDVTGTQESPRRAMGLATLYATGHGVVVFGLGLLAIVGGHQLPPWVDGVMERVVGVTLIVLSVVVAVSLLRDGDRFRMRSRWMVVAAGLGRVARWSRSRVVEIEHDHDHDHDGHRHDHVHPEPAPAVAPVPVLTRHRHLHRHVARLPEDPFARSGVAAALLGVAHGVGAETPTQVVVFLAAAHVAGTAGAVALLVLFIAGVFVSNTAIAAAASYGYLNVQRSFRVYAAFALTNAVLSLLIGTVFVLGRGSALPPILGG